MHQAIGVFALLLLGAAALSAYLFLSSSALLVYSEDGPLSPIGSVPTRNCTYFSGASTETMNLVVMYCPRWGKVGNYGVMPVH
jgi:hypothetical protein